MCCPLWLQTLGSWVPSGFSVLMAQLSWALPMFCLRNLRGWQRAGFLLYFLRREGSARVVCRLRMSPQTQRNVTLTYHCGSEWDVVDQGWCHSWDPHNQNDGSCKAPILWDHLEGEITAVLCIAKSHTFRIQSYDRWDSEGPKGLLALTLTYDKTQATPIPGTSARFLKVTEASTHYSSTFGWLHWNLGIPVHWVPPLWPIRALGCGLCSIQLPPMTPS
jgi:hypothetical protein